MLVPFIESQNKASPPYRVASCSYEAYFDILAAINI